MDEFKENFEIDKVETEEGEQIAEENTVLPSEYEVNSDVNNAGVNSNFEPFDYNKTVEKKPPYVNIE